MHTNERKEICEIQKSQKNRRRKNALCKECRNPTKNYEKPHAIYAQRTHGAVEIAPS